MKKRMIFIPSMLGAVGMLLSLVGYVSVFSSSFSGWMLGIGFLMMFYALPIASLFICGAASIWKELEKKELVAIGAGIVICGLFVFAKIANERFVYHWDYSAFWAMSIDFTNKLFSAPREALAELWYSINHAEYNQLTAMLMAVPLKLMGFSRVSYVMANWLFGAVPAAIIFSVAWVQAVPQIANRKLKFIGAALISLFFPAFFFPVMAGYIDALALVMAASAMCIFSANETGKLTVGRNVLLSIELVICLICRRYFGYFVLGFAIAYSLKGLIDVWVYRGRRHGFFIWIGNLLIIGAVSLAILLIGFSGLVEMSIFNNYAMAYQAYNDGMMASWKGLLAYFGIVCAVISLLGIVVLTSKAATISRGIGTIVGFLVTGTLFFFTQGMGVQHYYIVVPYVGYWILAGLSLYRCFSAVWLRRGLCVLSGILISINWLLGMGSLSGGRFEEYFTRYRIQTHARNDIGVLQSMVADLSEVVESGVYICASSAVLNDDIIRRVDLPYKSSSMEGILSVSHVDLRDGFPSTFLSADYVIATNYAQTHLNPEEQKVVVLLNEAMLGNTPISDCFECVEDYELDGGVTAYMYKKVKEFGDDELKWLKNLFDEHYSEYPELFADRIVR